MTTLKIFFGLSILLEVGCSTLPPPGIEAGRYKHPKYQISFEALPSPPWYQSKDLPCRFTPRSPTWVCTMGAFSDSIFVNNARNGAIAIETRKTRQNLGVVPPQRIEAVLKKQQEKGGGIKSAPFASNYNFKISAPYVCDTPLPLTHETFTMKSQGLNYRCEVRTYVYTINEDDTRYIYFFLWSAPNTYKENKAVFNRLLETLERIPQSVEKTDR